MATTIYPNMNMAVPVVGAEIGPAWANDINACLRVIDQHDHAPGAGVQITPAGLNINADLPFGSLAASNNATFVRSLRFDSQGAPFTLPADIGCLYEVGADLYFSDGAGNQVRITQGGSVVGPAGTITGLPSGTASASFAAATFRFESATNTPANMAVGPLIIGSNTLNSKTVTLSPDPAQGANYALTLPAAAPTGGTSLVSDSSGNLLWRTNPIDVNGNFDLSAPSGGTFYARLSDGFADSVTLLLNQAQNSNGRTWALKTRLNGGTSEFQVAYSAGVGGNVNGNTGYTTSLKGNNTGSWTIGNPAAIGSGTYAGQLLVGRTDSGSLPAGYVGEIVFGNFLGGVGSPASGVAGNIASIALTSGIWALSIGASVVGSGGFLSSNANIEGVLSTSPVGLVPVNGEGFGSAFAYVPNAPIAGATFSIQIPANVVGPTANQTFYFNVRILYGAGNPIWKGLMQAVRII